MIGLVLTVVLFVVANIGFCIRDSESKNENLKNAADLVSSYSGIGALLLFVAILFAMAFTMSPCRRNETEVDIGGSHVRYDNENKTFHKHYFDLNGFLPVEGVRECNEEEMEIVRGVLGEKSEMYGEMYEAACGDGSE